MEENGKKLNEIKVILLYLILIAVVTNAFLTAWQLCDRKKYEARNCFSENVEIA